MGRLKNHRPIRRDKAADFFCLFQWKNQLDASAPKWKRVYFRFYRWFNQFSRFKLGIPSYAGESKDGRLWWFDLQGATKEEWEAVAIAHSKGGNWGYMGINLGVLSDESTNLMTKFDYPAADLETRRKYLESKKPRPEVTPAEILNLVNMPSPQEPHNEPCSQQTQYDHE